MVGAMQGIIGFVFVFITALAIFNTMTMSVLERTNEIGVMRSMGLTRLGAVGMFLVEALFIGLLGGLGGACLGSLPAWYLEVKGVQIGNIAEQMGENFPMQSHFYADLTPEIFVNTVILGLVIALLGALLPAARAAFIQPVIAMKARR
jgi:putative ABC transport system permease protein